MPADRAAIRSGHPNRYRSAPELDYNDEYDSDSVYEVRTPRKLFPLKKRRCYRANGESDTEDMDSHMRNDSHSDDDTEDESHIPEF